MVGYIHTRQQQKGVKGGVGWLKEPSCAPPSPVSVGLVNAKPGSRKVNGWVGGGGGGG